MFYVFVNNFGQRDNFKSLSCQNMRIIVFLSLTNSVISIYQISFRFHLLSVRKLYFLIIELKFFFLFDMKIKTKSNRWERFEKIFDRYSTVKQWQQRQKLEFEDKSKANHNHAHGYIGLVHAALVPVFSVWAHAQAQLCVRLFAQPSLAALCALLAWHTSRDQFHIVLSHREKVSRWTQRHCPKQVAFQAQRTQGLICAKNNQIYFRFIA